MTIDTRHPQREGASKDPEAVRNALDKLRQQYFSILQNFGVAKDDCDLESKMLESTTNTLMDEVTARRIFEEWKHDAGK